MAVSNPSMVAVIPIFFAILSRAPEALSKSSRPAKSTGISGIQARIFINTSSAVSVMDEVTAKDITAPCAGSKKQRGH